MPSCQGVTLGSPCQKSLPELGPVVSQKAFPWGYLLWGGGRNSDLVSTILTKLGKEEGRGESLEDLCESGIFSTPGVILLHYKRHVPNWFI